MIENKGIGSKIFDVINVVILVLITLICILPVWYVLCVSLSSREAVQCRTGCSLAGGIQSPVISEDPGGE